MTYVLILLSMGFWNPGTIEKTEIATFSTKAECEAQINSLPMCHFTNKSCLCSEVK